MHATVKAYYDWLMESKVRKLFFWGTPGGLINEDKAAWYGKHLKNVKSIETGPGVHYLQENNPHLIGKGIADWLQ